MDEISGLSKDKDVSEDEVKEIIEEHDMGNYSKLNNIEKSEMYTVLAKRINDMIEKPSGKTASELGKATAGYIISTEDLGVICSSLVFKKSKEQNDSFSLEDLGFPEKIDIPEFDFNTENHEKASTPYGLNQIIAEDVADSVESLISHADLEMISRMHAKRIAELVNKTQTNKENSRKVKPKIKFPKFRKNRAKIKSIRKKGFMQEYKKKVEAKKRKKSNKLTKKAKKFYSKLETNIDEYMKKHRVELTTIKNPELRKKLNELRNSDNVDSKKINSLRELCLSGKNLKIDTLREALKTIQTGRAQEDLREQTSLTQEQIEKLVFGSSADVLEKNYMDLDENGNLEISKDIPLRVQDIKGTKLERELKRIVATPRIDDLTDTEIIQLAKSINVQKGKIRINFEYLRDGETPGDLSWIDEGENIPILGSNLDGITSENWKEYALEKNEKIHFKFGKKDVDLGIRKVWQPRRNMKTKAGIRLHLFKNLYGKDLYIPGMEYTLPSIENGFDSAETYTAILSELDSIEQKQKYKFLGRKIDEIENKSQEDKKISKSQRRDLKKEASKVVSNLKKQNSTISEDIIQKENWGKTILKKATRRLIPETVKEEHRVGKEVKEDIEKYMDNQK